MRAKPWEMPDGLRQRIGPLLPKNQRRLRYAGRKPLDDRAVLQGILFVLHTGVGWEHRPQELGFGCRMTTWHTGYAQPSGTYTATTTPLNACSRSRLRGAQSTDRGRPRPADAAVALPSLSCRTGRLR